MKYRLFMTLVAIVMLTGCVYHRMNADEIIADLHEIHSGSKSYINILWYNGSDEDYDYFGYVYGMLLGKNYKAPIGQFELDRMLYTEDSTKFVAIRAIKDRWSASRKHDTGWVEDEYGVTIEVKQSANNRFESDGLPFRCASGQAAAQAERYNLFEAHD